MHKRGLGTEQDDQRAFYAYQTAALQGNEQACKNLAFMYRHGQGCARYDKHLCVCVCVREREREREFVSLFIMKSWFYYYYYLFCNNNNYNYKMVGSHHPSQRTGRT